MGERVDGAVRTSPRTPPTSLATDSSEQAAERAMGRFVTMGLPAGCIVGAIIAGLAAGVGSALLVLASGALLGTIALLWASLRTLSGDAPLPVDFEGVSMRRADVDALGEKKRRVLRALKDLDAEHAVGKIDDADYEKYVARYREEAKSVMRDMDRDAAPLRAEAERVADAYLVKLGLSRQPSVGPPPTATPAESPPVAQAPPGRDATEERAATEDGGRPRVVCSGCRVSNEPDAQFCKGCGAAIQRGGPRESRDV